MASKMGKCLLLFLFFLCCFLGAHMSTAADEISWGQSLSGDQTIVSKGGFFELGFFTPAGNNNTHKYYIGIWYKKRPEKTIIWVANREKPVSDPSSSELRITHDGNLAIFVQSKTQIWSSNVTPKASNSSVALLLDSGNFVLADRLNPSMLYWQSFDHPTDTWLPGGSVGYNIRTKEYMTLTAWKSSEDPSPGVYSYGMDPKGSDELVQIWNGSVVYWTSGQWNGRYFSSVPELTRNEVYNYTYFATEKRLTYNLFDTKVITRLVADVSGLALQWAWLNNSGDWRLVWSQPRIQCQVYSLCGPFSICDDNGAPLCSCLQGFDPASRKDWDSQIWTGGCARRTQLQCRGMDKFLPIANMQLPAMSEVLKAKSAEECETACLNNCSCTAFAYMGSGCSMWYGDILNMKPSDNDTSNGAVSINLRLAASEIATPESPKSDKGVDTGIIIGAVGGGLVVLAIVTFLAWRCKKGRLLRISNKAKEGSLVLFRYRDLQSFTKNFSDRIGRGGFGSVFKGVLPDSSPFAVKKLEGVRQGEKQFRAEVSTIGTIQHVNLVRLRGFCCEGDKRLLVYEYMLNGSLDSHLFSKSSQVLGWKERWQIAVGTARGLAYLHEQCRECIIHCDIKPENILLDRDFCPKVADFGLAKLMGRDVSRVLTTVRGTIGYLAPEWISGLAITPKADVYSFGMVLFELISGQRNAALEDDGSISFFPIWAAKKVAASEVLKVLDTRLEGNADMEEVDRACKVACFCIQDEESDRPSMGQVVQMLEGMVEVSMPPIPKSLLHLVSDQSSRDFITDDEANSSTFMEQI